MTQQLIFNTPDNYWIYPGAISIQLNALDDANRIQCSVMSGATILCFVGGIKSESEGAEYAGNGDGLEYDYGHNIRKWYLTASPTFFNTNTAKFVYVAIPRSRVYGETAMVVFPSELLDIYGRNQQNAQVGAQDFFYIYLQAQITSSGTNGQTPRIWLNNKEIDFGKLRSDEQLLEGGGWYQYPYAQDGVQFLKPVYDAEFVDRIKIGNYYITADESGLYVNTNFWAYGSVAALTGNSSSSDSSSSDDPGGGIDVYTLWQVLSTYDGIHHIAPEYIQGNLTGITSVNTSAIVFGTGIVEIQGNTFSSHGLELNDNEKTLTFGEQGPSIESNSAKTALLFDSNIELNGGKSISWKTTSGNTTITDSLTMVASGNGAGNLNISAYNNINLFSSGGHVYIDTDLHMEQDAEVVLGTGGILFGSDARLLWDDTTNSITADDGNGNLVMLSVGDLAADRVKMDGYVEENNQLVVSSLTVAKSTYTNLLGVATNYIDLCRENWARLRIGTHMSGYNGNDTTIQWNILKNGKAQFKELILEGAQSAVVNPTRDTNGNFTQHLNAHFYTENSNVYVWFGDTMTTVYKITLEQITT